MTDIVWDDRTDAGVPTGATSEVSAAIMNAIKGAVNTKADKAGATFTGEVSFSGTTHAGLKLLSLTSTQRDALTPAVGMVIWNSTANQPQVRTGSAWVDLSSSTLVGLLASTQNGEGASAIGLEDAAGNWDTDNVEAALAQIAADYVQVEDVTPPDAKTVPIGADGFLVIDSEDSDALKTTTITEFLAALEGLLTAKTTPVVADAIPVFDSEDSDIPKKTTFTEILTAFDVVRGDTTKTLSVGYDATDYDGGTMTTGTYTPDPADSNSQFYVNNGAHTLAPPASSTTIVIHITNGASAGVITTSGFTVVDGASFTTTNTHEFICVVGRVNGKSFLTVKALQ